MTATPDFRATTASTANNLADHLSEMHKLTKRIRSTSSVMAKRVADMVDPDELHSFDEWDTLLGELADLRRDVDCLSHISATVAVKGVHLPANRVANKADVAPNTVKNWIKKKME